jgi:heme oxygenase
MSNKLKQLTWDHHQSAERRAFARKLLRGELTNHEYYVFLVCQWHNYSTLEKAAIIPPHLNAIKRADRIMEDIKELEELYGFGFPSGLPPSVKEYEVHIGQLAEYDNNHALLAHMYTRHFGELHGGQIIKKKIPGSGKMYEFEGDTKELISEFRKLLDDEMAEEAKRCFEFASKLFDELS